MMGVFLCAFIAAASGELVFQARWDDGSFDADLNKDGSILPWPSGYAANVYHERVGIDGRWAMNVTDPNAYLRYYIGDQSASGAHFALLKLNGWELGQNTGYYLAGLNNYGADKGISVRAENTYVRAYETTGGSPYIQPGGLILPASEWIFLAYSYDRTTGKSRMYLLDAFTGVGYDSGEFSGYGVYPFDLLTVGNAGAPSGGIQLGASVHGWVDGVRLYNTSMDLAEIQTVRTEMIPEPATLLLVIGGVMNFLRRRK
jgi:hypothetical protein